MLKENHTGPWAAGLEAAMARLRGSAPGRQGLIVGRRKRGRAEGGVRGRPIGVLLDEFSPAELAQLVAAGAGTGGHRPGRAGVWRPPASNRKQLRAYAQPALILIYSKRPITRALRSTFSCDSQNGPPETSVFQHVPVRWRLATDRPAWAEVAVGF